MRFLADENFPGNSVRLLQQRGFDVVQLEASEHGSPDEWVLRKAIAEQRTILTFDRDFGDLVYHYGQPAPAAGIVFFRARIFAPAEPAEWLLRLLAQQMPLAGFFATVTSELVRQRELPALPNP